MKYKSPFYVVEGFLSPKLCEHITDVIDLNYPNLNSANEPIKTTKINQRCETVILDRFESIVESVMRYYDTEYYGTTGVTFEMYDRGYKSTPAVCDNSRIINNKWHRTVDVDLTCVVFFVDYNNSQVDESTDVYGGKYEFPTHNFGFNASRGTMIVYPSGPNFINGISSVQAGRLVIAKFFIKTASTFIYNQSDFPGNYKLWYS